MSASSPYSLISGAIEMVDEVVVQSESGRTFNVGMVTHRYRMASGKRRGVKYVPVYDQRAIRLVADEAKHRVNQGFDCIIMVTGERRTGKSTFVEQCAVEIDKTFSVDHICFKLEDFNNRIRDAPYADPETKLYPQVVLDEAGVDLFSQEWWSLVQRNFTKKLEVIGLKRLIIWLVLPHRTKLNKAIREDMVHMWLHTLVYEGLRGMCEVTIGESNKWEANKYWRPYCALTFPQLSGPLWEAYSIKKRIFVDQMAGTSLTFDETKLSQHPRITKLMQQRDALIKTMLDKKFSTQRELADIIGAERSTISFAAKRAK